LDEGKEEEEEDEDDEDENRGRGRGRRRGGWRERSHTLAHLARMQDGSGVEG
jgi:hypothetical protein